MTELTYAGVAQSEIVKSILDLRNFIKQVNVPGAEILVQKADNLTIYATAIVSAQTAEELNKAVTKLPENCDLGYANRAFEHVLHTYSSIGHVDQDPLCKEAYQVLTGIRAFGGLPCSGFDVMSGEDSAAEVVFKSKLAFIEQTNGMFMKLPAEVPQLNWEYYVHPAAGVTRDDLAISIDDAIKTIKANDAGIASEFNRYGAHVREGKISSIHGSKRAITALQDFLKATGKTNENSFELSSAPKQFGEYDRSWISSYSYRNGY
jgi:hypothetical protein